MAGIANQSREDSRVGLAKHRPELGFSGLHLPVRPRPVWTGNPALPEPATLAPSDGTGAGGVAATHQCAPEPYTTAGIDWAGESKSARVVQLFQAGLPATSVSAAQSFRAASVGQTLAAPQSARLACAARC